MYTVGDGIVIGLTIHSSLLFVKVRIKSGPPPDQQLYVQHPADDDISIGEDPSVFDLGKVP